MLLSLMMQQQNQQYADPFHDEIGSEKIPTRMDQHAPGQAQQRHQPAPAALHGDKQAKAQAGQGREGCMPET